MLSNARQQQMSDVCSVQSQNSMLIESLQRKFQTLHLYLRKINKYVGHCLQHT